ncbi:terminase large subunit domain-containing protein [Bernardetia sp.]|uniref:terminase large subunit domain-containing protein n=1 Tax=Bernardetia sp. TaxID=1937974 RepID=UPI0025C3044C|nr:terminase large subunit [Bernardetia sp.]
MISKKGSKTLSFRYKRPWITSYQKAILDSPARYTVTEASTKAGKTASHIIWLFEQALQGKKGDNFWWVAPVFSQAEIAFNRMKSQITLPNFFKVNISKLKLTLPNGVHIWFKSADNPDSLYGDDVQAIVFDEFTRAKEAAWIAIRSVVTKTKGKIKFIGNCVGLKSWHGELITKAKVYTKENEGKDIENPEFEYFKITAYDAVEAGVLALEEVEQAKKDISEMEFKALYLVEPPDDGGNPFGLSHIAACLVPSLSKKPPVCYGIDLAKSVDYTVVIGLDEDGHLAYFERWQAPWKTTLRKLQGLENIEMLVDSTGVGDPIVEQLQDVFDFAEGYHFSSKSKQQLMEGLAVGIQQQALGFPDGILRYELDSFQYEHTRTSTRYSAPAGKHDDTVCALALAYRKFEELNRKPVSKPMPIFGGR